MAAFYVNYTPHEGLDIYGALDSGMTGNHSILIANTKIQ